MPKRSGACRGPLRITEPVARPAFPGSGCGSAVEELQWHGNRIEPLAEFADAALAEFVFHLLTLTVEEGHACESRRRAETRSCHTDYADFLTEYQHALTAFGRWSRISTRQWQRVDNAVYAAFGLTPEEQDDYHARLNRFPLDRLQPRYPWQAVRPRPIKAYTADRFA